MRESPDEVDGVAESKAIADRSSSRIKWTDADDHAVERPGGFSAQLGERLEEITMTFPFLKRRRNGNNEE